MQLKHRLQRLEERLQIGTDREGNCRFCTGREKELGSRHVVIDDRPLGLTFGSKPHRADDRTPTPCPKCGRDLNFYVEIVQVDMIAKRRGEGGR